MKRCWKSLKHRLTLLTVSFTLIVTVFLASISLFQFQEYGRRNLIQATEFNLHLVAGLVSQDLSSLGALRGWCAVSSQMSDYLTDASRDSVVAFQAYDRLQEELRYNRASGAVRRLIVFNRSIDRFLQVGSGAVDGKPVTVYNLSSIGSALAGADGTWRALEPDPYGSGGGPMVLTSIIPIYRQPSRNIIGYAYLAVSADLFTNPLKTYSLPDGCELFVTVGEQSYRLDGTFEPVPAPARAEPAADAVMDAKTRVYLLEDAGAQPLLTVSCPIAGTDIYLTQSLSASAILQQRWLYQRQLVLICAAVVLLGVVTAFLLNRMINTPVGKLRARIKAIAGGDFSPDPCIEWDNELGDIGRGVNELSTNVAALMEHRLEDEKKKRDLEYRMLQAQVNPHFLYNTLNSIKWMATIQHAEGIAEMTTSLARLLKNISKGQQALLPLRDELSLIDDYFLIQQYRYGGSVTLEKEVDEALMDNVIPRFTLQPLVENAIFHGIEPKGAGTVRICAHWQGGDPVDIVVTDDGVGMDAETIRRIFSGGEETSPGLFRSLGLLSVHQRLVYEFGPAYGLAIESEPGRFTSMRIRLPRQACAAFDGGTDSAGEKERKGEKHDKAAFGG